MNVEQLYREHYKPMVKRARGRVPNACMSLAEEAVQETFTRLLTYEDYIKANNIEGLLYTIMRTVISDMRQDERARGVVKESIDEVDLDILYIQVYPDLSQFDKVIEAREEVQWRIDQLKNEEHRYILELFFLYSLTAKEISQIVDSSYATVRQTISRFGKAWEK